LTWFRCGLCSTKARRGESSAGTDYSRGKECVLIRRKLLSIDVRYGEIPAQYVEAAKAKRAELVETLADVDEAIADAWLEEREIQPEELVVSLAPPVLDRCRRLACSCAGCPFP
jgi:translation elongation factor EF-G